MASLTARPFKFCHKRSSINYISFTNPVNISLTLTHLHFVHAIAFRLLTYHGFSKKKKKKQNKTKKKNRNKSFSCTKPFQLFPWTHSKNLCYTHKKMKDEVLGEKGLLAHYMVELQIWHTFITSALGRTQKPHTKALDVLPDSSAGGVSYSQEHLLSNVHTLETILITYFRLTNSLFLHVQFDS